MADTNSLQLYKNKDNTYQFSISAEGITLTDTTVRLCIHVADNMSVMYKCSASVIGEYNCEVKKTNFLPEGDHKCWLEVTTTNGLIFKPFVGRVDISVDRAHEDIKVVADVKSSKKSEEKTAKPHEKEEVKREKPTERTEPKKVEFEVEVKNKTDEKLHSILKDLGLSNSSKALQEKYTPKKKIPTIKSKFKA